MKKIWVVGIGPGHRDYILPAAYKAVENSDILVGGRRHLEIFHEYQGEICPITKDLESVINYIKEHREEKRITLILSGDTGFYSMLSYMKKHFCEEDLEVIPGINSLQYLFSRIKETWQETPLLSLHGRKENFIEKLKVYKKVGLLTDHLNTPEVIAKSLMDYGLKEARMVVGENLSYEEERIIKGKPEEIIRNAPYKMSVVVIFYE
ncbi:precorrin-6y C5,15-methyltransferase (decarboxylating) subunit CbiE [Clostridium formicaceticum]|uniref:Cobalt-precorrin-6Y C(5)-methyltransferase n=1 Tax=Clostridium formicaceticum TaxID=1497 RepID=A0AAC9RIK0_9CLOT|nr:precorrin-6y C5,15-methyltransferase (decarboxylating) subunit CbiE [Clostridium formicaceticum]AOY75463.1 precorrin-6y C5,15-methyltransferase (decarboxylating) subunit CbiE [Clostridium formicaceticum]ARE85748.1 putative cobalt-precorrin-6Y C(5)-methyltransferase [Clostridium formicaceticum]